MAKKFHAVSYTHLYEFLNKVDYEHFDVTLIGNGAKEEESSEKLNSLPKEIRVLYWKRSYPATDEEYVLSLIHI